MELRMIANDAKRHRRVETIPILVKLQQVAQTELAELGDGHPQSIPGGLRMDALSGPASPYELVGRHLVSRVVEASLGKPNQDAAGALELLTARVLTRRRPKPMALLVNNERLLLRICGGTIGGIEGVIELPRGLSTVFGARRALKAQSRS